MRRGLGLIQRDVRLARPWLQCRSGGSSSSSMSQVSSSASSSTTAAATQSRDLSSGSTVGSPPSSPRASEEATSSQKKIKVYTRTGDKGTSSLFSGERKPKDDVVFEALGATDELNSFIGIAREYCVLSNNGLDHYLQLIQSTLLDVGSHIATPRTSHSEARLRRTEFSDEYVDQLERWIDELDAPLPPLKNFILPSGGLSSSHLHACRSICRRAERQVVPLVRDGLTEESVGRYLNRLSDFFFVAARYAAHRDGAKEVIYKKEQDRK
ncbi:MMAB protein [Balamuthia mandrillaris]